MESYLNIDEIPPPKNNEFELTVFGPGFGESIVVYIPDLGWAVIDSCEFGPVNQRFVPPLQYLISRNAQKLAFLVLTHPHKDHYKGMEQIIDHYLGRIDRICRYAGDGVRELGAYLVNRSIKGTPGAVSLAAVLKAFKKAVDHGAESRRLGAMTQIIPRKNASVNNISFEVEVLSLSPLAADEESYIDILKEAFPKAKGQITEVPDHKHNLIASAIWILVGEVVVILGSDVEEGKTQSSGWRGVVGSVDAPDLCVKALKVSHHGSPNAHCKQAWEKHCERGEITSVVTPYDRGVLPRPSEEDIKRIGSNSKYVGITSHVSYLRPLEVYNRAIARRLPKKWKVVQPSKSCGMVTIRYDLKGNVIFQKAIPPANWIKFPN